MNESDELQNGNSSQATANLEDNSTQTSTPEEETSTSNEVVEEPSQTFKSLPPADVLYVTVDNAVKALFEDNLYSPEAESLSAFTSYDNIAVVSVGRFIDEKLNEGGYGLNTVANMTLDQSDGYDLVITYNKTTNEYDYFSNNAEAMELLDEWRASNPMEGDVTQFLNENASSFAEISQIEGFSETSTAVSHNTDEKDVPMTQVSGIVIVALLTSILFTIFIKSAVTNSNNSKSDSEKREEINKNIQKRLTNETKDSPINVPPVNPSEPETWSNNPIFEKTSRKEKERLSKIAEEKRLEDEKVTKEKKAYEKALVEENSYNDPNKTSLQNSIDRFEDLAIAHRYIDHGLANEISEYVANLRQLELRLLKAHATNSEKIRMDFKVVNDTVSRSLGRTYYIDISKNPKLWDSNAKRLNEVANALVKSNELVTDAIIKLNRNQVVDLRDGLSAILKRNDENIVEKMLESN